MREVSIWERIKWGGIKHPLDINVDDWRYNDDYVDQSYGTIVISLQEFVEEQDCNWEWFCYERNLNPDDKNGRW